jgi:predicted phosphate transport protein (TIGR00153 family)
MKRTIFDLFAKSPFGPLQDHMRKVMDCVSLIPDLYQTMEEDDEKNFHELVDRIKKAEHDADNIKNEIRGDIPKTIFTPVDRDDLLVVLSAQDSISDYAEDVAVLLSMKPLPFPATIRNEFWKFLEQVMITVGQYYFISEQLDELMEASFGGTEAEKVEDMIDNLGREEYKTDRLQHELVRKLLAMEEELGTLNVIMWMKVLEATGNMANSAEKVGNRLRLFLSK